VPAGWEHLFHPLTLIFPSRNGDRDQPACLVGPPQVRLALSSGCGPGSGFRGCVAQDQGRHDWAVGSQEEDGEGMRERGVLWASPCRGPRYQGCLRMHESLCCDNR
jgi:hypothetical protein